MLRHPGVTAPGLNEHRTEAQHRQRTRQGVGIKAGAQCIIVDTNIVLCCHAVALICTAEI